MFDIGWTELIVVAVIAILVVGPKELPSMLMTFGRTVGRMRRMANEFQSQFNDVLKEAERQANVDDVRKDLEAVTSIDPTKKPSNKPEVQSAPVKTGAANGSGEPQPASAPDVAPATDPLPEQASQKPTGEAEAAVPAPAPSGEPAESEQRS
ncbi:Sec-independent protein translocase protein TatB [Amorphus coralli]|uniref:Sec-independent protein translocase protein TatB n=1 Tax=Amorphus coralli TaxID=340680 RepID=UPI00037AF703|nr:Sec-independent protein translocase protein TatB [Amorphus coralli]